MYLYIFHFIFIYTFEAITNVFVIVVVLFHVLCGEILARARAQRAAASAFADVNDNSKK